jgi:hypothetical protein
MILSGSVVAGYSFGQFFYGPDMDGIAGDFSAWLSATALNLGLNYQAGSDARTSAANFYSAFETKLQEQQAVQAAQTSGAPLPVSGGAVVTSVSSGGLVTTVPASQAVYASTPAIASTQDFLPSSVSADQLTANALTPEQPSGIPWGAILTIASIALAAFGN